LVGSLDGTVIFREEIDGAAVEAEITGTRLAKRLISQGAGKLLDQVRAEVQASAGSTI